jgi:TrmH family RNA methyltransferase
VPSSDRVGEVGFALSITSPANPRIKDLARARRRRHRSGTLVDGFAELRLAVAAGARPLSVYFCPALADDRTGAHLDLLQRCAGAGAELIHVTAPVFEKITYRQSPDGWLAVLPAVATGLDRIALRPDALVLVCESVEKPGNLGAILRTADAAGLDAVIAAGPVTDWGNPNLVRASKGALFTVPVAEGSAVEVLDWLRARALRVVATTPDAPRPYSAADLTGATAIVVGSEQDGLSKIWLAGAAETVRIPMAGRVDSLNVATSAAILIYEAVRQRDQR